jgi:hypothetical protein
MIAFGLVWSDQSLLLEIDIVPALAFLCIWSDSVFFPLSELPLNTEH